MIEPGSQEWLSAISPSKTAAILGISRWESPYRLWHRMKGLLPGEPPRDAFRAGHAMEHALAYLWREENPGWLLSRGEIQISHSRFGFPVICTLDRRARPRGGSPRDRRVVEFKTATDLYNWGDPNLDGDAPADYVAQVTAQMHFSGYTEHVAHLMVMGPRFRWRTYTIGYDPELGNYIEARCAEFWRSLRADEPPDLDDSVPTYDAVRALHPDITDDVIELDSALAADWLAADRAHKQVEARLRALKSRVLDAMGSARVAVVGSAVVGDRRANGRGVSLYPNPKALPALEELTTA